MRLRRAHKPCTRCRHSFASHQLLVTDPLGRELRLPCGHMDAQPTFGGMFRVRACACPGYVAPAPRRLRLANRILSPWGLVFSLYLAMAVLSAVILVSLTALGVGL